MKIDKYTVTQTSPFRHAVTLPTKRAAFRYARRLVAPWSTVVATVSLAATGATVTNFDHRHANNSAH